MIHFNIILSTPHSTTLHLGSHSHLFLADFSAYTVCTFLIFCVCSTRCSCLGLFGPIKLITQYKLVYPARLRSPSCRIWQSSRYQNTVPNVYLSVPSIHIVRPHHLIRPLINLTSKGPCIVNVFSSIANKMQRYTIRLFLQNALHVSGGPSAHHQELKNCTYSVWYLFRCHGGVGTTPP
jgi:hypothetical protein